MNRDDIIRMAREAGMERCDCEPNCHLHTGGMGSLTTFAALVAAAEREVIAKMIEDAPPLVRFAQNDKGGCLMCGFTPKLAAETIRARGQ